MDDPDRRQSLGGSIMTALSVLSVASMLMQGSSEIRTISAKIPEKQVLVRSERPPMPRTASPGVWAATWSSVPDELEFVAPMVWVRDGRSGSDHFRPGGPPLVDARVITSELARLPEGRRSLHLWYYRDGIFRDPRDRVAGLPPTARSPWPDASVQDIQTQWSAFLQSLANGGVAPNLVVLDNEEPGLLTNWHLRAPGIEAVMMDPRFGLALASLPAGEEVAISPSTPPASLASPQAGKGYLTWNMTVSRLANDALTKALWQPLQAVFPSVRASNYQGTRIRIGDGASDLNGHEQPSDARFGTSSAPALYGQMEGLAKHASIDPADRTRVRFGGADRLGRSPWLAFIADVQMARAVRRSDDAPMQPWIASPSWQGDSSGTACYAEDPRYHDEMVRHVALLGTETFLVWNPPITPNNIDTPEAKHKRFEEARKLNDVLADLNRRLGGRIAEPVAAPRIAWDSNVLVTGSKIAPNSYLWRATVKPGIQGLRLDGRGGVIRIPPGEVGIWLTSSKPIIPNLQPDDSKPTLPGVTRRISVFPSWK